MSRPLSAASSAGGPVAAGSVRAWAGELAELATTRRRTVLACWAVVCLLLFGRGGGKSWHFFSHGATLLFGGGPAGGLHLYADQPQLQIGPLAFVVARPLTLLGPTAGRLAGELLMTLAGLMLLTGIDHIAHRVRRPDDRALAATLLVGGLLFIPVWVRLSAHVAHLDDVLALALAVLAVRALTAGRAAPLGLFLGLAVAAKPWAVAFLPLILALPACRRRAALTSCLTTVAIWWGPFVIADPHTLAAASFTIPNAPASALRVLGVDTAGTPSWCRPVQMLGGALLATVAVRRRRWPAVILVVIAVRLLLDPSVYGYYTAGAMVGALLWDTLRAGRPAPVWTAAMFAGLVAAPAVVSSPAALGELRAAVTLAAVAAALWLPARRAVTVAACPRTCRESTLRAGVLDDPVTGLGRAALVR